MTDTKANIEVSTNFPTCPSLIHCTVVGSRQSQSYRAERDGSLTTIDSAEFPCGSWWPHSATCVELVIDGERRFFQFIADGEWLSADGTRSISWTRKRSRESLPVHTPTKALTKLRRKTNNDSTTNISRFRMTVLPVDPLDETHRDQLQCMGLRVCRHSEVGRVLVTSRSFEDGEAVIFSRVHSFDVDTDDQVLNMIDPTHPTCCYLLVPRTRKLYYNRGTFCDADPIASGDLWYLVNHSHRPNLEVLLRRDGIQFKAKRAIQANEPLVWTYPPSFFGKGETSVDLPQNVIADGTISFR